MRFLYASGICVVLVRHNTTKSYAILLNTKARLHIRLYIMQLHIKTILYVNVHVQTAFRGTQYLPRPNGVGLYPGLSAISQAAFPKGLKGFSTRTPNVWLGISMSKDLLTPPRSI